MVKKKNSAFITLQYLIQNFRPHFPTWQPVQPIFLDILSVLRNKNVSVFLQTFFCFTFEEIAFDSLRNKIEEKGNKCLGISQSEYGSWLSSKTLGNPSFAQNLRLSHTQVQIYTTNRSQTFFKIGVPSGLQLY